MMKIDNFRFLIQTEGLMTSGVKQEEKPFNKHHL